MTVRRARFRCSVDGTFYYPLDEVLDLPPGEVTVSVGRRALRLATHMSFSELQEELFYQHDVHLSDTVLNRLMQQVGGVAEQDRKEVVEALRALPEGVAWEEHALSNPAIAHQKRLYISCDEVMYPTRYRQLEGDRKRLWSTVARFERIAHHDCRCRSRSDFVCSLRGFRRYNDAD